MYKLDRNNLGIHITSDDTSVLHGRTPHDYYRLLKLVSLVAFSGRPNENRCGLRLDHETRTNIDPHGHLHMMCMQYSGAVDWIAGERQGKRDAEELPTFALRAIVDLPDNTLTTLGQSVNDRLLLMNNEPSFLLLGRWWQSELMDACWRVQLDQVDVRIDDR